MPADINLGTIFASIQLRTDGLTTGIQSAKRQFAESGSYITKHLADIERAGQRMTIGITAPVLAAGGASAKFSMDFSDSMAKIVGLAGGTEEEIQGLRQSVLALAGDTARRPQDLADALYFIYSSGVKGAGAIDILNNSAKASAAGLGETAVIADVATSAVNAYGAGNITAAQTTDILTAAVREGKGEADAMAASIGRVLPIAAKMEVDFANVAAAMATMTRSGLDTDEAATALRGTLASLLDPAKQTEKALNSVGLTSAQVRKELSENLIQGLSHLTQAFKGNDEMLGQIFPNIRALIGVLNLTGQSAETVSQIFDSVRNSTGATDDAFKAMEKTTGFRLRQSFAKLQADAIRLGDTMSPAIDAISASVSGLASAMAGLGPAGNTMILAIGGVAAAIGPLLMGIAGVKNALTTLGVAGVTLKAVFSGPVLLAIVALIAAIVGLVALSNRLRRDTLADADAAEKSARAKLQQAEKTRDLVKEYNELQGKGTRAKQVLQDIAALNPNLISGFDKQGRAVGLLGDAAVQTASDFDTMYAAAVRAAQAANVARRSALLDQKSEAERRIATLKQEIAAGPGKFVYVQGAAVPVIHVTTDADMTAKKRQIVELGKTIAEAQKQYDALVPAGKALSRGQLTPMPVAAPKPTGKALSRGQLTPMPVAAPKPTGSGGGGSVSSGKSKSSEDKKTPQELADEAAQGAVSYLDNMRTLGKLSTDQVVEGLDKILSRQGDYAKMSLATEAQVSDRRQQLLTEQEAKRKEVADKAQADAEKRAEIELEIIRAAGDEKATIEAEYQARIKMLVKEGATEGQAHIIAAADRKRKLGDIEIEAARKKKQADDEAYQSAIKRLDYEYQHSLINVTQYVEALQAKQTAEQAYSDRWYELQARIEAANADTAERIIAHAELVAETNHDAAVTMLRDSLATYKAMGDAGVEACRRIEAAIDDLSSAKSKDKKKSQEWYAGYQEVLSNIRQQFVDAIAGMIEGTTSFGDFWKQLLGQMLRFFVNALLEMALQHFITHKKMQADAMATAAANAAAAGAGGIGGSGVGGIGGLITSLLPLALFDNPINDTAAVRSGADFARLFKQGAFADIGRIFPKTEAMTQPATIQHVTTHNEQIHVTTYADKIVGIEDVERISDTQAWMVNRKLKLAPTG